MSKRSRAITIICLLLLTGGGVWEVSHVFALSDADFQRIGNKYGVSPYLLLAISIVESQSGELLGKHEVRSVVKHTQLKFLQKIAAHTGRKVSEFRGSSAGAMGYMQIMPSTFYTYAQDGNGDGIKDPLHPLDSLATAAYYLAYRIASKKNLKTALKSYNNSDHYCDKVLQLASQLELDHQVAAREAR
ncbi:transglycosylase SLT domain-containing protein [candidate division KSB3 bacterium]|jgi:membrane-bound lytic murein transglycosylase B|uniref:Transglycosylase SLT domain-containing protein n=1 Tax=candidate division KSB3 bacterium TaxID=2044937 RepID=A0A9D5JYK6_9BACT|nr:transglycosylase SLT domain-containing protein [candidate division KSB3 bacterium]MBD3326588.1 transglycosylase SLT domain-containing protein [candidate division KSB3 bacterium]